MKLRLAGLGWVTPLGNTIEGVWEKLCAGEETQPQPFPESLGKKKSIAFRVPPDSIAKMAQYPRLRRSSAISRFATAAGLAALRDAGIELTPEKAERTALVFAISNGCVVYTKRFYHEIVQTGAQAASPLLFPETVFNAPASHVGAILGITGASYTLVGDGAVGLLALKMAENLLSNPELDRCLVVGAEEVDWLICDAYRRWRLLRADPPIEPFQQKPRGTILSEGAGAILLAREGAVALEQVNAGGNYRWRNELVRQIEAVCGWMERSSAPQLIVASANGTFIDRAEAEVFARQFPGAKICAPKRSLGESFAAASIWQVICAAQVLRTQQWPKMPEEFSATNGDAGEKLERALVVCCGMNQQVTALSLKNAE